MDKTISGLDLDTAHVPRELVLTDLGNPDMPSWLAMLCAVPWTVQCGICRTHIPRSDRAYYESAQEHPAHAGCWLRQLPSRDVRVESVRYH